MAHPPAPPLPTKADPDGYPPRLDRPANRAPRKFVSIGPHHPIIEHAYERR